MRSRSAGPLISKFRKRQLARKRERVSSMMSGEDGSAEGEEGGGGDEGACQHA